METLKVGIREFRDKLATYLLETEVPVAITRHGDTVGYYIPARHKRTEADRAALKETASRLQAALAAEGISEEEILKNFKSGALARVNEAWQWLSARRKHSAACRLWRPCPGTIGLTKHMEKPAQSGGFATSCATCVLTGLQESLNNDLV
jgi:PHD/YefM family antitoxin component YafN of YafNO toxin-antitoxin module